MKKIFAAILLCAVSVSFAQAQIGSAGIEKKAGSNKLWLSNPGTTEVAGVAGIDLNSAAGKLIPDPDEGLGPFKGGFYLSNTKNKVTLGVLGASKQIKLAPGSSAELPAGYDGDIGGGDLVAFIGIGTQQIALPVLSPLSASFSIDCTALACSFTSTSTGPATSWAWNFGDSATGTGATTSHTYAAPGTYSVKLDIAGAGGAAASTTGSVTVTPEPATGLLAAFAGLGVLGFRRRR